MMDNRMICSVPGVIPFGICEELKNDSARSGDSKNVLFRKKKDRINREDEIRCLSRGKTGNMDLPVPVRVI